MSLDESSNLSATILVVDDDRMIVHAVKKHLEKQGYTIFTAADGEEGLREVRIRTPQLIILDIMMPQMDGWTVIRRLRATPQTSLIPVIFLTAMAESENRLKGFQLGADDYLTKPFKMEELEFRVKNVLKRFKKMANSFQMTSPSQNAAPIGPGLNGQLEQLGLASLLTLINMERKSGQLMLIDMMTTETAKL